ncbi:MAG: flagellar motor protein MotB, partial [Raineya sp.]|nr:flagellar motor protein MotB [Raineya sp.]
MKIVFLLVGIGVFFSAFSQNIQWASRVIAVSSEKKSPSGKQYKAEQALGKPNVLPAFQSSPCAWSPQEPNNNKKEEFIHVGFDNPMSIKQILVAENFNAGAVAQIFAYDEVGKEYLLYKNPQVAPAGKGRLLSVIVPQTSFAVASLKVTLQTGKVNGENQIDAIGISDSDSPVQIQPNLGKSAIRYNSEPLSGINSQYLEANPIVTPNGKGIYFTRLNHPENIKDTIDG